ncbi:MAG: hypothetical protein CVU11_10000 [Bacteroidetes bacterium HGW-Bacteroidetes-6]|jgi:uncharacterized protein YuzE|nr:MAG: hypothetical protein CVU11_10000 [Bacteroidetes bacterium HGW-Bacteroidetes-6]
MKTPDFDHIIREALLSDARINDPAAENARERVWMKANPPKMYSTRSVVMHVAVAAVLVCLVSIGAFLLLTHTSHYSIIADKKAQIKIHIEQLKQNPIVPNEQKIIVYRDRIVFAEATYDTVVVNFPEIVYKTKTDTVYIEKQFENISLPADVVVSDEIWTEIPEQKQVKGILWWRTKPTFSNNVANIESSLVERKSIFKKMVISAQ